MAEPPRLRVDPDERVRPATPRGRRREAPRRVRRAKRRVLGRGVKVGALLCLWAGVVGGGALGYFPLTLPDPSPLTVAAPPPRRAILPRDGHPLARFGRFVVR